MSCLKPLFGSREKAHFSPRAESAQSRVWGLTCASSVRVCARCSVGHLQVQGPIEFCPNTMTQLSPV